MVVNPTNSPTFDEAAAAFFRTSMDNLLPAAAAAGVDHAVILSIVAVDGDHAVIAKTTYREWLASK